MPVIIYVGHDRNENLTREPDYNHEMRGVQEICDAMRERFDQEEAHYAVLVSPQHVGDVNYFRADLVIISEKGLGIIELKHYAGTLDCHREKRWKMIDSYGRTTIVKAGSYLNPHEQVRKYGAQVFKNIIKAQTDWIEGSDDEKQAYRLQTAVCFTNINANIEKCQKDVKKYYQNYKILGQWEKDFAVLHPSEVPDWAIRLRFEVWPEDQTGIGFPYSLTPEKIHKIATDLFECKIWTAMMEQPKPYAYLHIMRGDTPRHIFRLTRDFYVIGRDLSCNLLLPDRFENISRRHASLILKEGSYYLDDGEFENGTSMSTNGTYVNGLRVNKGELCKLEEGDEIVLGDRSCTLYFSQYPISAGKKKITNGAKTTVNLLMLDPDEFAEQPSSVTKLEESTKINAEEETWWGQVKRKLFW